MKHVLVVDDSADTRELVQMIFSGLEKEIQLDYASDSMEAITLFNANTYNACVLDVSLPGITGYYLGQLIRNVCTEMPLAFLTNYSGTLTKENAEVIQAEFWEKSEVFADPFQLRDMIKELASRDVDCAKTEVIEIPEVLKHLE